MSIFNVYIPGGAKTRKKVKQKGVRRAGFNNAGRRYHLVYDKYPGEWVLRKQGQLRPIKRFGTKDAGLTYSRRFVKARLGQLYVHGKDGKIATEYTYGRDPKRTKN